MLTFTLAALVVVAVLAYRADALALDGLARLLDSRAMVAGVAVLTVLVLGACWARWRPIPVVQDEMSYLLQAEIFARGRWALPAQPLPAFWEQPQVLVQPVVASKYFPGHALLLALGVLAGWPALVPLLLQGITGALLFALARRVASGAVALLAWVIWLASPIVLYFGPSYFSETTTVACWLAGWWALLEWRASRRLPWLLGVAACTGWCVVTRPLTGLAYAIPVGLVVLADVLRGYGRGNRAPQEQGHPQLQDQLAERHAEGAEGRARSQGNGFEGISPRPLFSLRDLRGRASGSGALPSRVSPWRDLGLALLVGALVLGIIPLWSARTTGDARVAPLMLYTAQYRPYDVPGFGLDTTPPGLAISPQLARLNLLDHSWHARHRPAALPRVLVERWQYLANMTWGSWHGVLALLALAGLLTLRGAPLFALASGATLLLVYLSFAAPAPWVLYYYESVPGFAYLAAAGLAWSASLVARARGGAGEWRSARLTPALGAGALLLALAGVATFRTVRGWHRDEQAGVARFDDFRDAIAPGRAVVFVRYAAGHDPNYSFIRNTADPARTRVWVVRDLGDSANAELLRRAPDRAAFVFDESRGTVSPWRPGPLLLRAVPSRLVP